MFPFIITQAGKKEVCGISLSLKMINALPLHFHQFQYSILGFSSSKQPSRRISLQQNLFSFADFNFIVKFCMACDPITFTDLIQKTLVSFIRLHLTLRDRIDLTFADFPSIIISFVFRTCATLTLFLLVNTENFLVVTCLLHHSKLITLCALSSIHLITKSHYISLLISKKV